MPKVSNMNVNATREVRVTFIRPLGTRLMWTHRYPTSRCLQSRGLCASAATAGLPIFCLTWLLLLVLLLALSFVIVPLQSSRPAHPTLGALAQLQCSSSHSRVIQFFRFGPAKILEIFDVTTNSQFSDCRFHVQY